MLNEYSSLGNWLQATQQSSKQTVTLNPFQTYQEWLNEHFNYTKPASNS